MEIRLRYGTGSLRFEVPNECVAGVFRPEEPGNDGERAAGPAGESAPRPGPGPDAVGALRAAAAGRVALLLVPDATRDPVDGPGFESVVAGLAGAKRVLPVVATGSHRADTPGNREIAARVRCALSEAGIPAEAPRLHDCREPDLREHGRTSRGTRLLLSSALEEAEVVVAAGDVKHHYFAGYSNPAKCLLPGIAGFETIEGNHRLALEPGSTAGHHPWHPDPARRRNPLAEDMVEAVDRVLEGRTGWALATVAAGGRTVRTDLGPMVPAIGAAMAAADRVGLRRSPRVRRLVVSAGGSPTDRTLYLSQRAIELTRTVAADGAEILLLAECADGIADNDTARRNFYDELTRPLDEVLVRVREGYRLYQHKAYRIAELLGRIDHLHLASSLPDEDVRRIHLDPAPDPLALVARWVDERPPGGIAFFDEAHRLCVLGETES